MTPLTQCQPATLGTKETRKDKEALVSSMQLNDNKAGMEGLDRDRINKIIFEASKGSRYYENEQKKEQQLNARLEDQQRRLQSLSPQQIDAGTLEADLLLAQLEGNRDLTHAIVHVDMDAFYAAVEMRDNPSLRNVPMAVGGASMLSTSNYLARRYGVRAAMPGFIGKKLCPNLVIVPTSFDKYIAVSKEIRAIMSEYDPNFSPMSLDEAYLDFTKHLKERETCSEAHRTFLRMPCTEELCNCQPTKSEAVDQDIPSVRLGQESVSGNKDHKGLNSQCVSSVKVGASSSEKASSIHNEDASVAPCDDSNGKDTTRCKSCGRLLDEHCGIQETFGRSVEDAVREMRERIYWKTKLTASAGIAPNTMLAKVCSDRNKPNGQYRIPSTVNAVMDFVDNLQIRKVSGIGKVSEAMLRGIGVKSCSDLYRKRGILYHLYSTISFKHFVQVSIGIGSTTVERDGERKSMSTERTFAELNQPSELYKKCEELSNALAEDLQQEQLVGKTVGIKLKTVTFDLKTRVQTLLNSTNDASQIYAATSDLLRTEIQLCKPEPLRLRLMGVRMSNLLAQNAGAEQRQGTITSLLQRMQTKSSKQQAPRKPEWGSQSGEASNATEDAIITHFENSEEKPEVPKLELTHQTLKDGMTGAQRGKGDNQANDGTLGLRSGYVRHRDTIYMCPICTKSMTLPTLESFNEHIDLCLLLTDDRYKPRPGNTDTHHFVGSNEDIENKDTFVCKSSKLLALTSSKKDIDLALHNEEIQEPKKHGYQMVTGPSSLATKSNYLFANTEKAQSSCSALNLNYMPNKKDNLYKTDVPAKESQGCTTSCDSKSVQSLPGHVCPNQTQGVRDVLQFSVHVEQCPSTSSSLPAKDDIPTDGIAELRSSKVYALGECREETSMDNTDSEDMGLCCPVCNVDKKGLSLDDFNQHIDSCLNRQTIKQMLQEDMPPAKKNKRSCQVIRTEPASKKKKLGTGTRTIDAFFV